MDKIGSWRCRMGVIAIIMTIMVLELKTPVSGGWQGLLDNKFILISYVVSFTGTYYFGRFTMSYLSILRSSRSIACGLMQCTC